ncbi:MAG: hypothetical protein AVO35_05910 [Candidatus Aegiribacteria sp. MLS_C]|nr:MAG: hypothetical protein AVO35_05910 [Candidatus Aegiribacteria sp. MLS_C]
MDYRTERMEAMRVLCVSHRGAYNRIGEAFERLCGLASENGIPMMEGSKWLGIYWDDPSEVPQEELRSEACMTVIGDPSVPVAEDVASRLLDAGTYLVGTYVGAYSGLGEAWGCIWEELQRRNLVPGKSPCFELYMSGGEDGLPEEEWVTELCVPVE